MQEFESYENPLNDLIDDKDSITLPSIWVNESPNYAINQRVMGLVASANSQVPVERQVLVSDALEVLDRALYKTALQFTNPEQRVFKVIREVSDFLNMATTGAKPVIAKDHTDLLQVGHPLSTKHHELSSEEILENEIRWKASDPRIADNFKPVVASAYRSPANSLERDYLVARLENASSQEVPRDIVISLISE